MKNKIRKIICVLLCLVCAVITCSCEKTTVNSEHEKTEIVIWTWDDTFNVKAAKMAADQYMCTHPGIKITVETKEREEILSKTKLMLSSKVYGNLPDVVMIEDYDIQDVLQSYEKEFVKLTDLVDYDQYVDYKKQLCEKNGEYYGIPFDCGVAALFYRLDILQAAGYEEADMQNLTWSEFIEIGNTVQKKTGVPMLTLDPTDIPLIRIMMQSCGKWYVGMDGKTADIEENDVLRQALDIYTQLLRSNIGVSVNGWNEFIQSFQEGQVASVISGGWIMSSIKVADSQEGMWRVAPIPAMDDSGTTPAASSVGGSSWYVLKNSPQSKLATEFMVEMFAENDDFVNSLVEAIGIIPTIKDSSKLPAYEKQDAFFGGQQVTKLLTEWAEIIPTVNYGSKTYEIEAILEAELQDALQSGEWELCMMHTQQKAEVVTRE